MGACELPSCCLLTDVSVVGSIVFVMSLYSGQSIFASAVLLGYVKSFSDPANVMGDSTPSGVPTNRNLAIFENTPCHFCTDNLLAHSIKARTGRPVIPLS